MEPTAPSVPSWDGFAVPDLPVAAAAADFELLAGVVRDDYSLAGQDTETGWSALHYAAWPLGARSIWAGGRERDRREVLMELCDQSGPSDLDAKDERGRTALHLAAMSNNAAAIKVLCGEANASTACRDEDGNTPLLLAVRLQHVAAVSALVDQGADLCAPDTADGSTALMWACGEAAGRAEVVRALLRSHEVGLNQTQGDGCTALHIAVKQGTEEIVRLLIDAGADPQIVNHRGMRAEDQAGVSSKCRNICRQGARGGPGGRPKTQVCSSCQEPLAQTAFAFAQWVAGRERVCNNCHLLGHRSAYLKCPAVGCAVTETEIAVLQSHVKAAHPPYVSRDLEAMWASVSQKRPKAPARKPASGDRGPKKGSKAAAKSQSSKAGLKAHRPAPSSRVPASGSAGPMYKTVQLKDIPGVIPSTGQVVKIKRVAALRQKRLDTAAAQARERAAKGKRTRFPVKDPNAELDMRSADLKATLAARGLNSKGTNYEMEERLSTHIYQDCIGHVDSRLVIKEIHDPDNPATMFVDRVVYGLFVADKARKICKGEILAEYVGEVKDKESLSKQTSAVDTGRHGVSKKDQEFCIDLLNTQCEAWLGSKKDDPRKHLVVDAITYRNGTALLNDYRGFNGLPDRQQNVLFREVVIDGWPHIFVVAIRDVSAGQELLTDYGDDFWETQAHIREEAEQIGEALALARQEEKQRVSEQVISTLLQHVTDSSATGSSSSAKNELASVVAKVRMVLDTEPAPPMTGASDARQPPRRPDVAKSDGCASDGEASSSSADETYGAGGIVARRIASPSAKRKRRRPRGSLANGKRRRDISRRDEGEVAGDTASDGSEADGDLARVPAAAPEGPAMMCPSCADMVAIPAFQAHLAECFAGKP